MKSVKLSLTVVFLAVSVCAYSIDGYGVMKSVEDRKTPSTTHALVKLELIDAGGSVSERIIEQWSREEGGKDASVIVFHSPASVKNSRFLILAEEGKDDAKYIYLPALKKVRRIAASEGDSSFMGTEFTYNDMSDRELDDYDYTLLGEEEVDGRICYIVESVPKAGTDSSYFKAVAWIVKDPEILTPVKIDMYEDKDTVIKRFTVAVLENVDGFWIPTEVSMKNLKTGNETVMIQQRLELNTSVNGRLFSTRFLETGKVR